MNNYFGGCGYRRLPCQNEIELSSDEKYQGYWEKRGYALYRTDLFTRVGSISSSLWYDGFLEFMLTNQPLVIPERAYFSLGDRVLLVFLY